MFEQWFIEEETIKSLIGLALLSVTAYLLADLVTPRSPAPTEPVEDRIDHLVETLNSTFGRDWPHLRPGTLQTRLRRSLPARHVALVPVVLMVEDCAAHQPLSGPTKRWWAAHQALRAGLV